LWFRNIWFDGQIEHPLIREVNSSQNLSVMQANHQLLGTRYLYCDGAPSLLFTENETNNKRLFGGANPTQYVKDGINDYVVNNDIDAVNPLRVGTKTSAIYRFFVPPKESRTVKLRLTNSGIDQLGSQELFGPAFDRLFGMRQKEADVFYDSISPSALTDDEKNVLRQALSGMLWNKQFYEYDIAQWLNEHNVDFYADSQRPFRNINWFHMSNSDVISMPDKWEYPWYAAWDLAFHTVVFSLIDPDFAKQQLNLMLNERYLHPNGQLPAYEWNFNDVNPPVHAAAAMFNYNVESVVDHREDFEFVERIFQQLLMNFTWWVNRKDSAGDNVFQGGFLGLDNIGVFDRSAKFPPGVTLDQADGTAWMAMYCLNMLQLAAILTRQDPAYEDQAIKFFEHFLWIAHAMNSSSGPRKIGLWDDEDGFYYDILRLPDGRAVRLKVRSIVGLISLCANSLFTPDILSGNRRFVERVTWFVRKHPELMSNIHVLGKPGPTGNYLISLLTEDKLRHVLARMLDENEFLGPYGIRSLSRVYAEHPYVVSIQGNSFSIDYEPAESTIGAFGGNSNWRGPVWFPTNMLIVRALLNLYAYYGDTFKVECPTGSGKQLTLFEVSKEISKRLIRTFLRDQNGKRPVYGGTEKFQTDPYWKDNILFYEYFHGDNGAGLGASHQTGWTGLVAILLKLFGTATSDAIIKGQAEEAIERLVTT
jgi:hypothetical protein